MTDKVFNFDQKTPYSKFIGKCRCDADSLKKLLRLLTAKIDATLWFRGKPAPFDQLVELAQSGDEMETSVKWEATRVITRIIDTPAWPILTQAGTGQHIREVCKIGLTLFYIKVFVNLTNNFFFININFY